MAPSSHAILLLLFIAVLSLEATAAGTEGVGSNASSSTVDATASTFIQASCTLPEPGPATQCSIEGQSDFYGLGVRMGIYFTWLTSWIANNFLEEEISSSLDTNAVFLLAITVTTVFNSIWGTLRIIDALVLLQLCFGFLFGVMSLWGYRTMFYHRMGQRARSHFGGFGTHLRLMLMAAISGYAVWFWFEGLDDGLIECNKREACGGLLTFFFAKVKLYGWIRTFYKISAVGCVIYYGMMAVVAIVWLALRCAKFLKNGKKGWMDGYEGKDEVDTGLNQRELSYAYLGLAGFNFCWMLFSALNVEFTLNWNHMTNVLGEHGILSGPGQQLPLLIGLFSFLRICWLIFKEYYVERHKRKEERSSQGVMGAATFLSVNAGSAPATPAVTMYPQQHTHVSSIPWLAAHTGRPWLHRVLVTFLPWLSDFEAFRTPRTDGHHFEPLTTEMSTLETQKSSYKSSAVEVDVESSGNSRAVPCEMRKI